MSEKVYCKYCGKSSRDIQNVTGGSCPNSPSGGHVAYGGREQSKYYCMILVICYNIINLKNAIDKAKE